MPRAIKSLNNYAPYLNDTPSHKPKSDIRDRMLTGLVALSTAVIIVGFVFAVAHFFGQPALVGGLIWPIEHALWFESRMVARFGYHAGMTNKSLLWTGITGATLAILCCATPLLVILLGAVGLSALIGYLDYVLLPAIAIFMGIVIYALWQRRPA